ncbi:MAG: hypothetical protein Q4C25_04630 [Bacillota bacterium]|nr:hypothetical protein [Bacillota bacterium]
MTYINTLCADVGTVNCPCPLAETGDCLICSRLSGKEQCDCGWAGVCIYNEYIQNDSIIRNRRQNGETPILKKTWYGSDLLVLVLKVTKGFALKAAQPGSFVFLKAKGKSDFSNVPVSVMRADPERGRLYLALKIISGKTKSIAEEERSLILRGVYRNGLLGKGTQGIVEDAGIRKGTQGIVEGAGIRKGDRQGSGIDADRRRWLIVTKGVGFAPAANLIRWADGKVDLDLLIDTEKVNEEIIMDHMQELIQNGGMNVRIEKGSLAQMTEAFGKERSKKRKALLAGKYDADQYDRIILLTSDYYIKTLAEYMEIPAEKLVFSNNFRMCCGEGICGACGQIDETGCVSKMCKCKTANPREL